MFAIRLISQEFDHVNGCTLLSSHDLQQKTDCAWFLIFSWPIHNEKMFSNRINNQKPDKWIISQLFQVSGLILVINLFSAIIQIRNI